MGQIIILEETTKHPITLMGSRAGICCLYTVSCCSRLYTASCSGTWHHSGLRIPGCRHALS